MTPRYIPLHTVRACCQEIARGIHPQHFPVTISAAVPNTHGQVWLIDKRGR